MAAGWAAASGLENPYLNLITLLSILLLTTFFFVSKMWLRIVNIVIFVGTGILFEPIGLLLLQAANYTSREDGVYKYYFVAAFQNPEGDNCRSGYGLCLCSSELLIHNYSVFGVRQS